MIFGMDFRRRSPPHGIAWYSDALFYVFLASGFVAWFLPSPPVHLSIRFIFIRAFLEELVFRAILLEALGEFITYRMGFISLANILVSLVFSLAHLFYHSLIWSAAVFVPSIIFGILWERYRNIMPVWLCHAFYNVLFFYRP